jgi:hypothetical protein
MNLGLDHPQWPGKLLRGLDGFLDAHRRMAGGHRHAIFREEILGLIFVDVHGCRVSPWIGELRALKQIGAVKGSARV